MDNIVLRTAVPILFLMGAGYLSRRMGVLKPGDERVLSAYLYYFALPALFFVNISEADFSPETLLFMLAGILPILAILAVFALLYVTLRFSRDVFFLLTLSTVFGSLAFFGIPFVTFAYPGVGEHLAALSSAFIAMVSVTLALFFLELYKLGSSTKAAGVKRVAVRLSRNPLIISILAGVPFSLVGFEIPALVSDPLHMLGDTTLVVAIFMLGVFLYGRRYARLGDAFKLSLLRMVFLPTVAFLTVRLLELGGIDGSVLVIMHGTPVAISMIVLSERYNFYKEMMVSLVLVSSLSATVCLNLWLLLLGVR
ncbi:MAG: AEC family transporter [Candidatus Bathyarchaeia archaeon]